MSLEQAVLAGVMAVLTAGAWRPARLGAAAAGASAIALAATLALRWVRIGHPPVFGTFEMNVAETACLLATALPIARAAGRATLCPPSLLAIGTLGHALTLDSAPTPLTISEASLWIDLHAALAWTAWTALCHGAFAAFRADDNRALRLLGLAFVAQTALACVGAYYSTLLFATAWSWDPVQSFGLIAWILLGMALHFRLFFHVTPYRQRWFVAGCVAAYALAAKLPIYLPRGQTFHVFELGRMAGP